MSDVAAAQKKVTLLSLLRESPILVAGLSILGFWMLVAIFAPLIAPFGPNQNLVPMAPPGSRTPDGRLMLLGADHLGRDVLSRTVHGARYSLFIGIGGTAISALTVGKKDAPGRAREPAASVAATAILAVSAAGFDPATEPFLVICTVTVLPVGAVCSVNAHALTVPAPSIGTSDSSC